MSSEQATKYEHLLSDDDRAKQRATLDSQTVRVQVAPASGEERYRVHVGHGDLLCCPFVTHADRYYRAVEGDPWRPDGTVEWAALPAPVKAAVVEAVAGVDAPADLAPTMPTGGESDAE